MLQHLRLTRSFGSALCLYQAARFTRNYTYCLVSRLLLYFLKTCTEQPHLFMAEASHAAA